MKPFNISTDDPKDASPEASGEASRNGALSADPDSSETGARVIDLEMSPAELDELDAKILAHLANDARMPFLSIASTLDVDEKTIRNRVGKLRDAGVLQTSLQIQPNRLQAFFVSHIGIHLRPEEKANKNAVAYRLSRLPQVNWCSVVLGQYDLLLEAVFRSFEEMKDFELKRLPAEKEIQSNESFLTLTHLGESGISLQPSFFHR